MFFVFFFIFVIGLCINLAIGFFNQNKLYTYYYNQPPFGWRSPSNILYNEQDKYFYVTVTTFPYNNQLGGTTIMRTNTIEIPNSWKCWDGNDYAVNISINPYIDTNLNPNDYICTIVTNSTYPTILYNSYFKKYKKNIIFHFQKKATVTLLGKTCFLNTKN